MSTRLLALALLALAACREDDARIPPAVALTDEAVGHFCQMEILEHGGPKAQVHLQGFEAPVWFAQIRDAVAFLRMPEQLAAVTAVYVNDMAAAGSWDAPGIDNWIAVDAAVYVVGSDARGGMGAPEIVPFGSLEAALAFAGQHGGEPTAYADIPDGAVLGEVEIRTDGS